MRDLFYLFSTLWPPDGIRELSWGRVPEVGSFLGYLFTARTLRPQSLCGNKRGETDERSKEGMTPLIPSCLLCHPPGGKFNKVHIPRPTWERWEYMKGKMVRWRDGERGRWRDGNDDWPLSHGVISDLQNSQRALNPRREDEIEMPHKYLLTHIQANKQYWHKNRARALTYLQKYTHVQLTQAHSLTHR